MFVAAGLGFRGTVLLAVPTRPDQVAGIRCQDVISRALIENAPAHLFVLVVGDPLRGFQLLVSASTIFVVATVRRAQ